MTTSLPLFPLHKVLFPGTPIHIHVFEPRYQAMVGHCVAESAPFGVALIRDGVEALGPLPQPHEVGCTARIARVERVGRGRMNLVGVGAERFRIVSLRSDEPYWMADVEPMPMPDAMSGERRRFERQLRLSLGKYLEVLAAASETQADLSPERLPADPQALGYLAASLLPIDVALKQRLLASADLSDLLGEVSRLYRWELPVLQTLIAQPGGETPELFSRN